MNDRGFCLIHSAIIALVPLLLGVSAPDLYAKNFNQHYQHAKNKRLATPKRIYIFNTNSRNKSKFSRDLSEVRKLLTDLNSKTKALAMNLSNTQFTPPEKSKNGKLRLWIVQLKRKYERFLLELDNYD